MTKTVSIQAGVRNVASLLFFLALTVLYSGCDNKNSATVAANSTTTDAGNLRGDSANAMEDRFLYTVEIDRATVTALSARVPKNPSNRRKGKLVFQFSTPDVTNAQGFFDLLVYSTHNHRSDYGASQPRILVKALTPYLKIQPQTQYVLGNNEKSLKELKQIVQGLNWTRLVLFPYVDESREVKYIIIPYNNNTPLRDINGFNFKEKVADQLFLTNPSPPARPYSPESDNTPSDDSIS